MDRRTLKIIERHLKKVKNANRWKKIVALSCCLVTVITISALTLPAISQSDDVYCGYEEHRHTEACYTYELICEINDETQPETAPPTEAETTVTDPVTEAVTEDPAYSEPVTELSVNEEEASADVSTASVNETEAATAETTATVTTTQEPAEPETITQAATEETTVKKHNHTEDCYFKILICDKEEHVHSNACLSDVTADTETEEDWIKTVSRVDLTDDAGKDMLSIARTQLGYSESKKHFDTSSVNGQNKNGYTRYGEWAGTPYADWNFLFVSFCAHYAKIETLPQSEDCLDWINILKEESSPYYYEFEGYIPRPGDVIFFDSDSDGFIDRAGIMESLDESEQFFTVIEGDVKGKVEEVNYPIDEPTVVCCITHPETRKDKRLVLEEQKITAEIYTDESHIKLSEDDTFITVQGMLPVGATAKAHPVSLESDFLEGQSLVAAYDITIIDENGNIFNQSQYGDKLIVTIQPPGIENENDDLSVYYVPEDGKPESMNVLKSKDAISFETDHFSVYAITRAGTLSTVYINGQTGNDNNSGSSSSPVKTFEKALELLAGEGTIYISGTVTISGNQIWSLGEGQKIQRASSFTDALIKVPSGAELTLADITINGGANDPTSTNIATTSTYATGKSKAPILVIESGGTANIKSGAVLENNSNEPNMSSNKLVESGYIGMGGAIYSSGSLNMTGGTIRNCEAQCGGGVYLNGGTFYMSGGTIDNNYARDIVSYRNRMENYHKNAGGGVYLNTGSHMYLSGGTISNNQSSREGGGISLGWLNRSNGSAVSDYNTFLTMTGGTVTENFAVSTGGGINITAGCEATISAGYITNNTAQGREYQDSDTYVNAGTYCEVFTGGGIYLDAQQTDSRGNYAGVPGKCVIHRVIITDNEASYGGGIASCATSDTTLGTDVDIGDGTAIYGNTSDNNDQLYIYQGNANIGNTVLGGGSYNWTKSGTYYYKNSLTDSSQAIKNAQALATVFITGNSGYLGGGIGCNGIVFVGTTDEDDDVTSISIEKKWVDTVSSHRPEYITVQLYQNNKAYGDPIRIYPTVNENGEQVWPVYYVDDLPDGYTYTIKEVSVPGYSSNVTSSDRRFTITNTLTGFTVEKVWVNDEEADRPGSITVQLYQNGVAYGEVETLNEGNNWGYIWMDLPETDSSGNKYSYTAKEINVPNGYICTEPGKLNSNGVWVIENTKIPDTSVSVMKKWADGTAGTDYVTIQLLANGEAYGNPVKLNAENSWFYIWDNLPSLTSGGEAITYTVKEERVHGYISEIETGTDAPSRVAWTQVSSLTAGETYMFVSSNGALTGGSSDKLVWMDVSQYLENDTAPAGSALWTYSNSGYLSNGSNRYLALQSSGSSFNRTYTFYTATSGSSITFSNGRLYSRSGISNRYFTGINSSSYGTTSTTQSSATNFTVYELRQEKTETGETHYVITNTKRNDSLTIWFTKYIAKEDETDTFPVLPGAELALYRWVEGGELIPGTSYNGVLVDQWTSESAISSGGGAYGVDLTDGIYYLIETKAPSGYAAPFEPIIFEVDADKGEINIIQYPVYEEYLPSFSEDGVITGSDSINIPVYNSLVLELPETGGPGTYYYTSGGLLLILSAVILLLYKKRHGKEERKFS